MFVAVFSCFVSNERITLALTTHHITDKIRTCPNEQGSFFTREMKKCVKPLVANHRAYDRPAPCAFAELLSVLSTVCRSKCEQYIAAFHQQGTPGTRSAKLFILNPNKGCVGVNVTMPSNSAGVDVRDFLAQDDVLTVPIGVSYMLDGSGDDVNNGTDGNSTVRTVFH